MSKGTIIVGGILLLILGAALLGPAISPYDRNDQDLSEQNRSPSWQHPFGTDGKGRDIMTRVFWGGRITFTIGIAAVAISLCIGLFYGALAGYVGGAVDAAMMRFVDVLYGLPSIAYIILLINVFERRGDELPFFADHRTEWAILLMTVALGSISWLTLSRIVRGQTLAIKEMEYVEAARAMGIGGARIVVRHILPNMIGPIIVYTTLTIPSIMLSEAFISFLGLGIRPPEPSWGNLIAEGAQALMPGAVYWWTLIFPALFLAVTLYCLNALGDRLRDVLCDNRA